MRVHENYRICDRCKEKIDENWYRKLNVTVLKKKWIFDGFVSDEESDLCANCTEKFQRFMRMEIDDNKPTEYEEHHAYKSN